jgi:glutamine synthetase
MYSRSWSRPGTAGVGRPGFVAEFAGWDDEQVEAAARIEAELAGVDLVRLVFCDPHGLARSKTLTAETFRAALRNGMDFSPGPFLFDTGHAVAVAFLNEPALGDPALGVAEIAGAGDFVVVPDPLTFQMLPREGARTAWVLGDEFQRDGSRHPLSCRDVLRRVCARYAGHHLAPVVGLEVEWYLTRRLPGPVGNAGNGFGTQGAAPTVAAVNSGYQFNSDSAYDSLASVTDPLALRLVELGLPLRSMEHESGPGQVETTFNPLTALDAADAMLLFRTQVKQTCARTGHHASFMAVPPIDGVDPSGWHLHQSVVHTPSGRNVFAGADVGPDGDDLSADGKAYVDGLLARARQYCLLSVPTVNGHRRLDPAYSLSPTRIGWAFEDRGAMVRVLGGGASTHVENRTGEPTANPYLAIAAQLSAGLDGLVGTAPGGDRVGTLPASLAESLAEFTAGPAADLLGAPLAACLALLKRSEADRFLAWCERERPPAGQLTEWERREYFEHY